MLRKVLSFLAIGGLAIAAALAARRWLRRVPPADGGGVLAAVPPDAWLLVTADVAALRRSGWIASLLDGGEDAGSEADAARSGAVPSHIASGLGSWAVPCGRRLLVGVRDVAFAAPEHGAPGDFGIAFSGDLHKAELVACAAQSIAARGGRVRTTEQGAFTVVDDLGGRSHARLAYRDGGPFLVGRGAWLNAMMNAATAHDPPTVAGEHVALRRTLGLRPIAKGAERALVATALLPDSLREELTREIGSPASMAHGEGKRVVAALLAVRSLGIAVSAGGPGSVTQVDVLLHCTAPAACEGVKAFLEEQRSMGSRAMAVQWLGLGSLLDSMTLEIHGAALTVSAQAPSDDWARAAKLLVGVEGSSLLGRRTFPGAR